MKIFNKITLELCFSLAILFTIVGTVTAACVCPEHPITNIGFKKVPYNIAGVFTTVSGITCNSTSGAFDANNSGIVYNVTQYDRLFMIGDDVSSSPLFFAIDDKQGTHFFSYGNDGNATFFRSGTIKSDDFFSTKMLTSSGSVATAQTAFAVRNGTTDKCDRTTSPNLTGTWITAQNSVYQINNQEGNVFTGRVTASGKTTSTRFAGYIDKVEEDGTAKIVILCEKRNLMLGNVKVSTHNITIPYVLYADGRVASSPLTTGEVEWVGTNMSYNITQKYDTVLNSDGITKDTSEQVCLLSVSDASKGRYNLTSNSDNITIIGIAQGDNSFFEYSPKTGLFGGFVKGKTKYDFRGGPDLAEASVNYLN
jgi:hypothetical protein